MERETFEQFCKNMHQEHVYSVPRETNYKEFGKPYNEYVINNLNFLHNAYEGKTTKQAREALDVIYKSAGMHSL